MSGRDAPTTRRPAVAGIFTRGAVANQRGQAMRGSKGKEVATVKAGVALTFTVCTLVVCCQATQFFTRDSILGLIGRQKLTIADRRANFTW